MLKLSEVQTVLNFQEHLIKLRSLKQKLNDGETITLMIGDEQVEVTSVQMRNEAEYQLNNYFDEKIKQVRDALKALGVNPDE